LKTTRLGYDGKGQARVTAQTDLREVLASFGGADLIAEEVIAFSCEISVIVARDCHGKSVFYGPMQNTHKNHILSRTIYPAQISQDVCQRAIDVTRTLAEQVNLIGVLGLEMFVTQSGDILANEIAPRTHNSGHWSIDACAVSQFENHVRAVCGLSVSDPVPHHAAEMINLIGSDILTVEDYISRPAACVHLYGKADIQSGRKMGHVTVLKERL
jgi:5-(carboxyamino)imidazole ribonucleotide synthase